MAVARERASSAALAITNALAQRDSTRDAAADDRRVSRLLGDSLRMFRRRVVQVAQRGDVLDKALGQGRIERASVTATIDSLRRVSSAAVLSTPEKIAHSAWGASPVTLRGSRLWGEREKSRAGGREPGGGEGPPARA